MIGRSDKHTPFRNMKNSTKDGGWYPQNDYYMPTKKQLEYFNNLKSKCIELEIDLHNFTLSTRNRSETNKSIRGLIGLLKRHGYDTHGNKIEEES